MASQDQNTEDSQSENVNSNNVGALLQASRLRLGDDLRYVAETLHIRFIYLEAIEAGRYDDLPGVAYAIGFIRSYADYLGLDSEEVVRRYKVESASQSGTTELVFPVPIPESSVPGGAIVLVGVIVALLVYGGWYASTTKDGLLGGLVSPVPERLSENEQVSEPAAMPEPVVVEQDKGPVAEVVQSVTPATQEVVEAAPNVAPVDVKPAPVVEAAEKIVDKPVMEVPVQAPVQAIAEVKPTPEKVEQEAVTTPEVKPVVVEEPAPKPVAEPEPTPEPEAPAQVASLPEAEVVEDEGSDPVDLPTETPVESEVVPENKIYGVENEDSRILVKARRNSWIQVRDNNAQKLLLTRLLKAGDSYRVPNQPDLVLLTGNAGALEILVDGSSVPDLGPPGTIRKNVTLDPDKLRQGTAAQ